MKALLFDRVQVNYLGPFLMTRLLESQLLQCRARVVNVSSVMHRVSLIPSAREFLTSHKAGSVSWSLTFAEIGESITAMTCMRKQEDRGPNDQSLSCRHIWKH